MNSNRAQYLGEHPILEAFDEFLDAPRIPYRTVVGEHLSGYMTFKDLTHGEYIFEFPNNRAAVLMIDGPHEEYKFVVAEVYRQEDGPASVHKLYGLSMVARPENFSRYLVHVGINRNAAANALEYISICPAHPISQPGSYQHRGREIELTDIPFTPTTGRMRAITETKMDYAATRLERWLA